MVIVYDLQTKEIISTEDNTLFPSLPDGDTQTKVQLLQKDGRGFISLPYEYGTKINDYSLIFNEYNEFLGLQPKEQN